MAALGALAACATPPAPADAGPDPFDVQIRVGRLGVMVDQGFLAFSQLNSDSVVITRSDLQPSAAKGQEAELHVSLVRTVMDIGLLQGVSCGTVLPEKSEACATGFEPDWAENLNATPSLAEIDMRTDETQAAIMPLWSALCDKAVAKTGNDMFCAIE